MTGHTLIDTCPLCAAPIPASAFAEHDGIWVNTITLEAGTPTRNAVPIRPREAQVLKLLIEAHGRLVPYITFEDNIWPDEQPLSFNCRNNINVYICNLRKLLDVRFKCVPGIGYALD